MRYLRLIVIVGALALASAACGGSTSGDGTVPPADGGDTQSVEPDGDGENGGNGGSTGNGVGDIVTGDGSAHYEVSGDVTTGGDLAFIDVTSVFDGAAGQAYLTFSNGGDEILVVALDRQSGSAVQFGNQEIAISPTPQGCTFDIDQLDDSNASGSFDCQNQLAFKGDQIATASITGSFEAHK